MPSGNKEIWKKGIDTQFNAETAVAAGYKGATSPKRQRNKTMSDIARKIAAAPISKDATRKALASMGLEDEELVNGAMVAASIFQQAAKGNVNAYDRWIELTKEKEIDTKSIYHLDLDEIADPFHTVMRDIRRGYHTKYLCHGGRGSTKSSFVAAVIIELIKNNNGINALILRKVGNTLKDSVFAEVQNAISRQGLDDEFTSTKSPMEITYKPTGQKIYFRGADKKEKIKSIKPAKGYIGVLWFEEFDQFGGEEEIRSIRQSALRGGEKAFEFYSFNPPKTKSSWANIYASTPRDDMLVHKSSYKDVPPEWLGEPFIDEAEHLKEVNPKAYQHEYLGDPTGDGGAVFDLIEARTITDEEISHFDKIYQGVDFGWYPDQFAFVRTYYNSAKETIYIFDEYYVNKQSNAETGKWIKEKGYDDYTIICDSAEPKSVADYRAMGLPARGAVKGAGSVDYGFKWLQCRNIVIDPKRTPNAYREIVNYEYMRDKDGNVISGYPDANDHAISALRYAYEPLFNRRAYHA